MKKYIFLLLVTALSFAQASNQMVTFTQAQSLGFSLKSGQSHTTSNQCMTKSEALAKYNLDANAMASYATNQLVPKSVWINGVVGVPFTTNLIQYGNSTNACASPAPYGSTLYTVTGIANGVIIYTDESCTIQASLTTLRYFIAIQGGVKMTFSLNSDSFLVYPFLCQ